MRRLAIFGLAAVTITTGLIATGIHVWIDKGRDLDPRRFLIE